MVFILRSGKTVRLIIIASLLMHAALFNLSCSHVTQVKKETSYDKNIRKINHLGTRKAGHIQLHDGSIFKSDFLNINGENIKFKNADTKDITTLPIYAVDKIWFKDRLVGSAFGFLQGAGAGFGISTLIVLPGVINDSGDEGAGLVFLIALPVCAALGSIAGFALGNNLVYDFDNF